MQQIPHHRTNPLQTLCSNAENATLGPTVGAMPLSIALVSLTEISYGKRLFYPAKVTNITLFPRFISLLYMCVFRVHKGMLFLCFYTRLPQALLRQHTHTTRSITLQSSRTNLSVGVFSRRNPPHSSGVILQAQNHSLVAKEERVEVLDSDCEGLDSSSHLVNNIFIDRIHLCYSNILFSSQMC